METLTTYRLTYEERREAKELLGGLTKVFDADPDLNATTRERLETSLNWFWRNGSNPVPADRFDGHVDALDLLIERLNDQTDPTFWAAAASTVPHTTDAPAVFGEQMAATRQQQAARLTDFRNRVTRPAT